jgi:hypothetical protein
MSCIDFPSPPLSVQPRATSLLHFDPTEHYANVDEVSEDLYYLTIDGDGRDVPEVLDLAMGALVALELEVLEHELALISNTRCALMGGALRRRGPRETCFSFNKTLMHGSNTYKVGERRTLLLDPLRDHVTV